MIRYTVFYPMDDAEDHLSMECDRTGMQVLKMEQTKEPQQWMYSKYGQEMRPWECIVKIPNTVSGDCGQFEEGSYDKNLFYSFQKRNNRKTEVIMEREPKRMVEIQNPKTYNGEYGKQKHDEQGYKDSVYIINGILNKVEGNFLSGFFLSEIANSNIVIGPYPLYEIDIDKIASTGVTQVLNLQTAIEVKQRGVDTEQMQLFYKAKGIKNIVSYPIDDSNQDSLHKGLLGAAEQLHKMYSNGGGKNSKIYVHCTSSCTRSPSVVLTYLCLYVRAHKFRDPVGVAHLIKSCHKPSFPNMRAV